MATDANLMGGLHHHDRSDVSLWKTVKGILEPIASLKLTVVLFALSIFLILAGTFAQVDKDIWEVIGLYFRCWFAWIPLQVFFPLSFFPDDPVTISERIGIWFPGGKLLGLVLAMNLVAAHVVRFKAVASGGRMIFGLATIGVGCLITYAIIVSGGNSKGILSQPWLPYSTQWIGYQGLLAFTDICAGFAFITLCMQPLPQSRDGRVKQIFVRAMLLFMAAVLGALLAWTIQRGPAGRPSDASLRILWQLTQGTTASIALLLGCAIVFGKRAGIVLLHSGIGLMMFYELHVALTAVETQMSFAEGERTNYTQDIRTFELAVSDVTSPDSDKVVAFPKSVVLESLARKEPIDFPDLPFKIEVREFFKNSKLRGVSSKVPNPATAGNGLIWSATAATPGAGTDNDNKIDVPSAYVTLVSKSDGRPLGTYLVSLLFAMSDEPEIVHLDDKTYNIELRPKRYYKPYTFELEDVKKEDYLGTNTPRNYASKVHLLDPSRNVDEEKTIWMNNPLRFADETFYQSGYTPETASEPERATLSVVANSGWMMPYIGCMLVGIGMLSHFLTVLIRFLMDDPHFARRAPPPTSLRLFVTAAQYLSNSNVAEDPAEQSERATKLAAKLGMKAPTPAESASKQIEPRQNGWGPTIAAALALCAMGYVVASAMPPRAKNSTVDLYRFGEIPVVSEGRSKPLDSAARSDLLAISGRTEVVEESEEPPTFVQRMMGRRREKKIPAIQWLLEVISDAEVADNRKVFRIENLELQETIGVKKREGMRYSRNEIRKYDDEFEKQVELAREKARNDSKRLSVYQKKVLELSEKLSTYENLKFAFGLQNRIGGETQDEVLRSFQRVAMFSEQLEERGQPVFAIGPTKEDEKWHMYSRAWILDLMNRVQKNGKESKTVEAWDRILKASADWNSEDSKDQDVAKNESPKSKAEKAADFNSAVEALLTLTDRNPPRDVTPWVIHLEAYMNHAQPFTIAVRLYLVAFILGALGWLAWPRTFNLAASSILIVTLVLHSAALIARLIISGRPPVTNLYSSAIFIGWGCVVLGLLFEVIYRIGIGNLVAAVAGYATLLVADGLAADGDTFTVLQAVLDTQFWLATHVTCITMGYATTYLAGLFGVAYIIRGVFTPSMTAEEGRDIYRMIYGTLCFSIFFSFVGTVLGGLWADDSWGRFWGWDPKENAALIIVLWNALALHARWGGMVRERGLAALAVGGNIFVSWSWWGVNALGAGLHSYGFKQGTLQYLGLFALANLAIIGIGMLPKSMWRSLRRRAAEA